MLSEVFVESRMLPKLCSSRTCKEAANLDSDVNGKLSRQATPHSAFSGRVVTFDMELVDPPFQKFEYLAIKITLLRYMSK